MPAKVELFVDLDRVGADAAGALDAHVQERLYDTLDWWRMTRANILPDVALTVARARSSAGTAWLPISERGRGRADRFGSWYTLRYAPIFSGSLDHRGKVALVTAIAREVRRRFGRIALRPLAGDDLALLRESFASAGWRVREAAEEVNWVANVRGDSFEAYWSRRPGQLRSTVKRKAAKADLAVRLFDRFEPDAWRDYEAVFRASWKGAEGSPAFLKAFAQWAGEIGRLRMGVGYAPDGAPLAAQFWTVDGPVATIHKLAYVDAAKALSPGSILSHAMFEHVIGRDRPEMIDFGTGDDPYKADWMDERRTLHRLDLYDPLSLDGLSGYVRARAAALVANRRAA